MALHRCLLIACVTLSQACDSKRTAPVAEKLPAIAPEIFVEPDAPTTKLFEALRAAAPAEQFVLAIGPARYPVRYTPAAIADGPGMVATLHANGEVGVWSTSGTEGSPAKPKLVAPLDEPGKNAIRAALADVATRTGAKRIDVIVDRAQPGHALAALLDSMRPPFEDVRVVAGVPTTPSHVSIKVDAPELQAAIAGNEESLRRCFEESLRQDGPVASVHLEVECTIVEAGRVSMAGVGGSHSPHLADCVSDAIRGWTIDAKPGRYQFHITLKAQ